jgi:hypothetical protein
MFKAKAMKSMKFLALCKVCCVLFGARFGAVSAILLVATCRPIQAGRSTASYPGWIPHATEAQIFWDLATRKKKSRACLLQFDVCLLNGLEKFSCP